MAIPDKPESRAEMYLNKIASGSGTIPAQPESRLEQYLDAIARNGGGGSGGGGSGGGVEIVYLTLASSNGKEYYCTIQIPMIVDPVTGATRIGSALHPNVGPDTSLTFGVPKLGSGPVAVPLDALFTQEDFSTVDMQVMPTASGGASFLGDHIELTSDGTVAFGGTTGVG